MPKRPEITGRLGPIFHYDRSTSPFPYRSKFATETLRGLSSIQTFNPLRGKQIYDWDDLDYQANLAIESAIEALLAQRPILTQPTQSMALLTDLTVGEVSRHFDVNMSGEINGWMQHQFVSGFLALGHVSAGGTALMGGVGVGRGTSSLSASIEATSSTDLLSDSFLVVFDRVLPDGDIDTVRAIIPNERVGQQEISRLLGGYGAAMGPQCWRDHALRGMLPRILSTFPLYGSLAGDKLSAYARTQSSTRPPVSFVGSPIRPGVYFAVTIRFGVGEWLELFPTSALDALTQLVPAICAQYGVPIGSRP